MEDVSAKWYWVPHPKYSYVPAKLVKELGPSCILQSYHDGEELTYPTKHIEELSLASESSLPGDIENLTALNEFTEGAIVHQLRCRYGKNTIYTSVGDILVSVNPYKMLPIYTSNVLYQYLNQGQSSAQLPPHIFATASNALEGLLRDDENQSIVISGESGAGKTEATKLILQFLGDVAGDSVDEVQQIVLESQPLLEAFGNAKTLRNNNSSRFGKWVEVTFDDGQVSGGRMFNYSLEKARVVYQLKGERNYHSFYYLLAGLSKDKLRQIGLDESESYKYLNMSGNLDLGSGNDHEEFQSMMNAFDHMDFKKDVVTEIFRVLSVILNLGNVKLEDQQDHDGSVIMNPGQVERCATVLKVDADKLQRALLHRTVTVGSDTAYVPLRASDSTSSRDAVAKAMYSKLFDWLVRQINNCLERSQSKRFIGLLDIFGFEIFDDNGFEQFCINYANEKFQQFFNSQIMKMEQQEYKDNGIDIEYIEFVDNQATLDMIEDKRMGIFAMLDEQVSLPKGNDKQFVDNLHQKFAAVTKHPSYQRVKKNNDLFCVRHFAGTVAYNSKGMVEKNSDKLHTIWSDLLATSKLSLLVKLFTDDVAKPNGAPPVAGKRPPRSPRLGGRKKITTLSGQFKTELADLLSTIRATQPHFVRCIKPNKEKLADTFDSNMVLEQLKASGLFEAVKIRKSGFPFRKDHSQFVARYMVCIPKTLRSPQEGSDDKKKCEQIVYSLGEDVDPADIQIGSSKVFYRTKPMDLLERYRDEALFAVAVLIQKIIRGYMARKKFRSVEKVYKSLKAAIESRQLAELNAAVELAERLSINIYAVKQAKAAEKEIINEAHKALKEAMQSKDLESLNLAIEYGEEIRLADFANQDVTATIVEAEELRGLLREKQAAEQRLKESLDEFDLETLNPAIELAERLGVAAEILESAYDLRNELEYEESLFDALRDATRTKDLAKVEGVLGACSDLRPNDKREKALDEARAFIVKYFAVKIEKAIASEEEREVQRALRETRDRNLQSHLKAVVQRGEAFLVEQERRREEARRIAEQQRRAEEAEKAKQRKLEEERLARMKAEAEAKRRAAEQAEAERIRKQKEKEEAERKRREREELQRVETLRLQKEEAERLRREAEERERAAKAEAERKELEEKERLLREQEERVRLARQDEERAKRAQAALRGEDVGEGEAAAAAAFGEHANANGVERPPPAGTLEGPTSPRLSAIAAQNAYAASLSPPASPRVGPDVSPRGTDSMRRFMDTFGKNTERRNSLSHASSAASSVGTLSRMSTSASINGLDDDDSVTVPCAACSSVNSYPESKLDGYRMVKCAYCSHFWVPPPVETEMPPTVSLVNPDHTGMMKKRGVKTFKKSWKTRYCIVHEDYLYWMKSPRDEFPLGRLRLAEEGLTLKTMDARTTQITTSVKKYVFQTKQGMHMAEWLAAFNKVIDRAAESRQANTMAKSPAAGTKGRSTRKGTFNRFQRITVKSAIGKIARDFKGLFTLLDIDRALAYRFAEREIDRKMLGKISFAELRDIVPEIIPLTVILEYIKLKVKNNALTDLKENTFDVTFNARPLGFEVLNKSLIIVNVERGSLAEESGVVRGCRIISCNGHEATIERITHPGMPMALTFATYTSWEDEPPEAKEAYDKAQQAAADAAMDVDSSRSAATPGAAGEGYAQHQQVPQPGAGVPPPPTRGLPGLPVNPYEDDAKQNPHMEVEDDPMGDAFQTLGLENEMEDYTPFFERLRGAHQLKDFSLLRDPEDFAKKSRRREKTMRNMLVWQKDLIPRPLLDIDPTYCGGDMQAVRYVKFTGRELFKKILGYMRDRYHATPVTLAYEVVHTGVAEPLLRDTIFVILIKQTTNNPLARSELLGWKLMYMCLSSFAPSAELSLIILSHIAARAQSRPPDTVSSFSTCEDAAFACFRQFRRTTMIGPRDEPPPIVEIEAFTEFNSVALKVYTEDGRYHRVTLSAGDATTIGDVKEHMCGLVGIQGDTSSFEIQVQCEDRSPVRAPSGPKSFFKRKEQEQIAESAMVDTFMIPPNKQVFLCLSEWEDESVKNSNLKYSIIFRKSRYESRDQMPSNEDPGYIQMIYFQAQSDVRSGRFQLELSVLAKLAAVQLAIEQGLMQADECVSLMSFPELAAYLPYYGLTAMSFDDWKANLRNEIGSLLESAPQHSAEDQMHYFYLTYIGMVNDQPLYGCSYFYGQVHPELNGTAMGERVCLAVNWKGVSVVNASSYEHIAFMPLESVDKLVLIQRDSFQFLAHTEKLSYVQLFTVTSSNAQGCYELLEQLVRAYKQMSNF